MLKVLIHYFVCCISLVKIFNLIKTLVFSWGALVFGVDILPNNQPDVIFYLLFLELNKQEKLSRGYCFLSASPTANYPKPRLPQSSTHDQPPKLTVALFPTIG